MNGVAMGSHYYSTYIYYWVIIILHLKIRITQALLGYDSPGVPCKQVIFITQSCVARCFIEEEISMAISPIIMDIY